MSVVKMIYNRPELTADGRPCIAHQVGSLSLCIFSSLLCTCYIFYRLYFVYIIDMHHLRALVGVGLAGLAAGVPLTDKISVKPRQAPGAQNVVYWGQNGGGTIENNDLAAYCQPNSGIDVLVLAFLYQFGNGGNIPSGTIGQFFFYFYFLFYVLNLLLSWKPRAYGEATYLSIHV